MHLKNIRSDYLTGLILSNTGLGLINQPSRDAVTKVWRLSWITCFYLLTLIWVGSLGLCFRGGGYFPCLKIVRIMLETWNLIRKYKHICSFRKYTVKYQDPLNFADVSIFLQKKLAFLLGKNSTFTQSNKFYRLYVRNPASRKMKMTSQFADMRSSSIFLTLFCFSCQV